MTAAVYTETLERLSIHDRAKTEIARLFGDMSTTMPYSSDSQSVTFFVASGYTSMLEGKILC
jgi:hypothetical protein